MRRSPTTFFPRLETLGDRVVPAANASLANNVLTITDDGTGTIDNQVRVRLNGNNVEVTADGQTQTFRNAARSLSLLNADLGAGNDSLTIDLDDLDGRGRQLGLIANAGEGNNTIRLNADNLDRGSTVVAVLIAGGGDDDVRVNVDNIRRDSTFVVASDLGAGNDRFDYTVNDAQRNVTQLLMLNTGAGADTVNLDLGETRTNDHVTANVDLGAGDAATDTVRLSSDDQGRNVSSVINIANATTTGTTGLDAISRTDLDSDVQVNVTGTSPTTGSTGGQFGTGTTGATG